MKIAIDTNIFIYAVRFKIDVFSQLKGEEICTTESVMEELEKLSKGKSRDAKAAALALQILKKQTDNKSITVLPSELSNADDGLLELGKKGYTIATQDRGLIERLKKENCKIMQIRQKKYLEP